jgi:type I restriction enzyme S subunit
MKLGEVCESISQTFRKQKKEVVLINTSDVLDGEVANHEYVPNENLRGQFKKTFQQDDILYSEIRPRNRRFAYVDFDASDYIASTKLMVIRSNEKVLPQFLFQILKSDEIIDKLQLLAETRSGTFPQIIFSELADLDVRIPPIDEQRTIADTLSALDDRIAANKAINHRLEQMAQAIFKSWFVDFEPWDGTMPNDWREVQLGDIVQSIDNRGKTPPLASEPTDYPIIDVRVLSGSQRVMDFTYCTKFVKAETYNSWFRNGHPQPYDILLSTVGSVAEMKLFLGNRGCIAQNVVGLRSKIPLYLYQYLQYIRNDLVSYDIGSVQPSIKVTHIIKHPVLFPSEETLQRFNEILQPMSESIYETYLQSTRLAALRDTLLPRLMSGELSIADAKR